MVAPATDREYTEPTPSIEKMGCRLCRRPRERNQELFEGRADPEADIATDVGAGVKEAEMNRLRFGPGLLVTAAFIGPGTLVTASRAGAGYGVTLLWAILFSVAATAIIQDMAARVGLAGRRGLAEGMCCNFQKAARERLVESTGLRFIGVTSPLVKNCTLRR